MDELTKRLSSLDSCAVSDALDRLALPGSCIGIGLMTTAPNPVTGRVLTVQVAPRRGDGPAPHLGSRAIMAAGPGDVIVVDNRGRTDVSAWGGLLSLAAQQRGVQGVIVDGACRDVDEAAAMGFAVFARAAVPVTARGRIAEQSFNAPITVGAVAVDPGDLVIADRSGVVFVPAARAGEVLDMAEAIAGREAAMADAVRAGEPIVDVMHDDRFDAPGGGR